MYVACRVGKTFVIMPRSTQASLLKNSLSDEGVIYVICLISSSCPHGSLLDRRNKMAPKILIPLFVAVFIRIVTGIRPDSPKPRLWITFRPARQLWQLVSAMAGTLTAVERASSSMPRVL